MKQVMSQFDSIVGCAPQLVAPGAGVGEACSLPGAVFAREARAAGPKGRGPTL